MDEKKVSVGVIGVGMVGNAVVEYFKAKPEFVVFGYDKSKKIGSIEDVAKADYVFLCLPSLTCSDGTQDLDAFAEVLPQLPDGAKVIVKSTVVPGTTAGYQARFPKLFVMHNPEFLDARTAVRDFAEPDVQVVGYTEASKQFANDVLALLPPAPHTFLSTTDESEMVKYFMNTFMATKNTFANQMYDYCANKGIAYDSVKDIVKFFPRMGSEVHLRVFQDGYRGFQGACLPKDIAALTHDAAVRNKPLKLLELVDVLNHAYVAQEPVGES